MLSMSGSPGECSSPLDLERSDAWSNEDGVLGAAIFSGVLGTAGG